jgi:CRP/FNR family cyclic AMP-dependent transcriptional regulator
MSAGELWGWLAAALMVSSFFCERTTSLRMTAVGASSCFLIYGLSLGLTPVVSLHFILIFVNVWRLFQIVPATPKVQERIIIASNDQQASGLEQRGGCPGFESKPRSTADVCR